MLQNFLKEGMDKLEKKFGPLDDNTAKLKSISHPADKFIACLGMNLKEIGHKPPIKIRDELLRALSRVKGEQLSMNVLAAKNYQLDWAQSPVEPAKAPEKKR